MRCERLQLSRNRLRKKIPLLTCNEMQKFRWFAGLVFVCTISILILSKQKIVPGNEKNENMKYILLWANPQRDPLYRMGKGQNEFLRRLCPVNNCFIMSDIDFLHNVQDSDEDFLNSVKDFDAILFHIPEFYKKYVRFPIERSFHQKYVFVSRESPAYYQLDSPRYDGFFNWTYTYKLNSDIYFGYIIIRNKDGDIIGPKKDMHWLDAKDMKAIDSEFRKKLDSKRLTAAWFVSNCYTLSKREGIALILQEELARHGLVLDIYTETCISKRTKSCPKGPDLNPAGPDCLRKIETDYYFYLAFENSFSEDYATEKLLHALQHHAVPIVYGGANYTRFLPDGSYLDARKLDMEELVNKIVVSTLHKEVYYDFFKWTNHYSYQGIDETPETDYMCSLCKAINDGVLMKQVSVYKNIRQWWNQTSLS